MDGASVVAAASGVDLIVHAANPPRYRNWPGLVLPMLENSIAAARASGARIVLPATVYNFAPDAGPMISEIAPQAPVTRKGKIRVAMEGALRRAATDAVRSLVVRAGDFFGPAAPNSALAWLVGRRGGAARFVYAPGAAPHAFAYLPDLAETTARLVDRESELEDLAVFHFAGHVLTPRALGQAIGRAVGRPDLPIRPFPHLMLTALAPFNETFREMVEMRYLWDRPIGLDNAKLTAFLGAEPHTPLPTALNAALEDLLTPAAKTPSMARLALAHV